MVVIEECMMVVGSGASCDDRICWQQELTVVEVEVATTTEMGWWWQLIQYNDERDKCGSS